MSNMTVKLIWAIGYILLAPFIGGLLDGLDRKIAARMQRRVGPPVLQPFYDVKKLLNKQTIAVSKSQQFLLISYMAIMILSGSMFFGGTDMMMTFFVMSTAATFLYFAGVITNSPYSTIGSSRELIQEMAYEPAVLFTAVGFYLATGTFNVSMVSNAKYSAIMYLPGIFIAFLFILNIKMRKSPFDTATSHHPHQELIKGITSEMGSKNLALFQITEWYETVFMLGVIGLFIVNKNPWSYLAAVAVILLSYFLEILIDNSSARMKWQKMLKLAWGVTLIAAGANVIVLMLHK